ncbi:MAG TPA: threonine synthase [Gaiellaceae bacterium]|nr:threonine synthase [Gaiellaceae bacterium]
MSSRIPLSERFRDWLPIGPDTPIVTLGEGDTPLLPAPRISARLGLDIWLKWEGVNPTGSFKDRGMTVAVSKAVEEGARAVVCASTGNTAASAAAYAARAGLSALVLQPAGAVALGKLAQARAAGARVLEVRGSFDQALDAARRLTERGTHVLVNSLNPYRLQGQKTAAFEIVEKLGEPPAVLALPYGGGGNTRAYVLGFDEADAGLPRVLAVESSQRAETAASAIRIAAPAHAAEVELALERAGGMIVKVSDDALLEGWRALAQEEGVFCEPASAAGVAGLGQAGLAPGTRVVCVITGHGLKDPDAVERLTPPPVAVDPDPDAIAAVA